MLTIQINEKVLSNINGNCDSTFWATGVIEPWLTSGGARKDMQTTVHKTVYKYKTRFKEAWEELADK